MAEAFKTIKATADSPTEVRKVLEAVAFLAPETADALTTIMNGQDIAELPEGYIPVGLVTKDGFTFGGDTETTPVEAFGYAQAVREDITKATRTITFTAYEVFRRALLELAYGIDLSEVTPGENGEIMFDHPDLPEQRYYRLVVIGRDGAGEKTIYRAKFFPRVSIASIPEEAWNTEALRFDVALTAYVDDELGTCEREFIGGPGVSAEALGFAGA